MSERTHDVGRACLVEPIENSELLNAIAAEVPVNEVTGVEIQRSIDDMEWLAADKA